MIFEFGRHKHPESAAFVFESFKKVNSILQDPRREAAVKTVFPKDELLSKDLSKWEKTVPLHIDAMERYVEVGDISEK